MKLDSNLIQENQPKIPHFRQDGNSRTLFQRCPPPARTDLEDDEQKFIVKRG